MITIGRLAQYAGVTIRVYHAKGLLPEPGRDRSGYRRYTAQHAIDLIKIRTLADAGVPLPESGNSARPPTPTSARPAMTSIPISRLASANSAEPSNTCAA